jgi:hypothetical protein
LELLVEQQRWEELPDDVEPLLIPGPPLPSALPELTGLVAESVNSDPTLGFNLGAWNGRATQGRVDFSAACGIPAVLVNNACLRLARLRSTAQADLRVRCGTPQRRELGQILAATDCSRPLTDGYSCSRRTAVAWRAWRLSPAGDGIKGE